MGGRGSGGSRSGGGGASANPPRLVNMNDYYKEKYSEMTDAELKRAYTNAQNLMKKEQIKVEYEQEKLSKMVEEFKSLPNHAPNLNEKWDAIEKQTSILNEARSKADIRSSAFLLAVNERYNVREKQTTADLSKMTNGQLNSYYNRTYVAGAKARTKAEKTNNPKTRAKYTKLYEEHYQNFFKANAEKEKRSLWGRDW